MDQIMWNFSIYVHVKHILHSSDTNARHNAKQKNGLDKLGIGPPLGHTFDDKQELKH